jgi:competence protein ComGC
MRAALTRIEIVVIILVIVLLVSLLIPFALQQRTAARSTLCQDRQRRLAQAMQAFDAEDGYLPGYKNLVRNDRITGWVLPILPLLTSTDDRSIPKFQEAYDDFITDNIGPTHFAELLCPAVPEYKREAPLAYVVNCGMPDVDDDPEVPPDWQANGVCFDLTQLEPLRVKVSLEWISKHDGAKVTLLLAENVDATSWRSPNEQETGFLWAANMEGGVPSPHPTLLKINERRGEWDPSGKFARPSSEHRGGVNVAMASGQTQFLNDQIDYLAFQRLMTSDGANVKVPNQDEPLPPPWQYSAGKAEGP